MVMDIWHAVICMQLCCGLHWPALACTGLHRPAPYLRSITLVESKENPQTGQVVRSRTSYYGGLVQGGEKAPRSKQPRPFVV